MQIADAQALRNKSSTKTGVDLRWHKPEEYKKLTKEQRSELYTWQNTKEGKEIISKQKKDARVSNKPSRASKYKTKIAALEAELKAAKEDPTVEEMSNIIQAAHASHVASVQLPPPPQNIPPPATSPHVAAALELRKILKRKREENTPPQE